MSYDRWNARTCNIPEALLTFGIKTEIRKAKPYVKLNKADIANNLALPGKINSVMFWDWGSCYREFFTG